jgi:TPR repeat protein
MNYSKAAQYYKLSANQGHSGGQFCYGLCLEHGQGVSMNYSEAAKYYKLSANQGHSFGQYFYGHCLETGQGVSVNYSEAAQYYKLSADQGHTVAQFRYDVCTEKILRISRNLERATSYFKYAADSGYADGKFYSEGRVVVSSTKCVDLVQAAQQLKDSADKGTSGSQVNYGGCLLNGWGVRKDEYEAARYFKLAADQGDSYGELNYGLCLMNGQGISQNIIEAVHYFRLSAKGTNPSGQTLLGICHRLGIGCCLDRTESAELFKMAADERDAHAQFNYGVMLAEQSQSYSDLWEASQYFKKSADQQFVPGAVNYGICLFEGLGVDIDYDEAVRYLRLAADEGDTIGEMLYGICLFSGKGVSRDAAKAIEYFKRSATHGNIEGQVNVGFCYHAGLGVDRNALRAAEYFKEAADQGNCVGCLNYGLCCLKGDGVPVDFIEAVEYFKDGMEAGYFHAHRALVVCLSEGRLGHAGALFAEFYAGQGNDPTESEAEDGAWDQIRWIESPTQMKSVNRGRSMKLSDPFVEETLSVKQIKAQSRPRKRSLFDDMEMIFWRLRMDPKLLVEVKTLGAGMFGVVKLMENSKGDKFAVKIFMRQCHVSEEKLRETFMRESEGLFRLQHPCVIPLYGLWRGLEDVLVMKYMENGSLSAVLKAVKKNKIPTFWTPTGIAIIVCGIVCGLEFVHSQNFVHRDLKPANLLIDEAGRCRIGDLGSSKFIEAAGRWTGGVVGTVMYAAPELYDNPPYSSKIDVFAFGLILYEIMVGRPVFATNLSNEQMMRHAIEGTRAELPDWMSGRVKSLIRRCWAVDPKTRPPFSVIMQELKQIGFKILPDVDSFAVAAFVSDVELEVNESSSKSV